MKKIFSSVQQVDIFGQTISLNINKDTNYKTVFGGITSILIIGILIVFFFSNVMDFLNQSEIIFSSETKFQSDPENLMMTSQNFMAAFSIEQEGNGYAVNPYFNISIEQRHYFRDANGTLNKKKTQILLEPCTLSHFDILLKDSSLKFQDQYNQLGLSNWLCPQKNYIFNLSGTYSSEDFYFMKIIVTDCNRGQVSATGWNPQCANDTVREQHLQSQGQFKFQMYQINSIVNPDQPKSYINTYLDGEMYFTFVPKKLSRQANLFYRKYQFYNDLSLLPLQDIHPEDTIVRENSDFRDLTELGRDTDDLYAIIYLRRSQFTELINRRFVKIGELLSYLGGFLQIMITGLGIFIIYYNRISMQVDLSNKLYNFKNTLNDGQQKVKVTQVQNQLQSSMLDEQANFNNKDIDLNQTKDYLKNAIIKQFSYDNKVTLTFKLILNQLSFGLLFKNQDAQFLNKAIDRVNNDLNIHDILYKIQEIQKLKQVLFRRPQIILFNFTPKPIITLDSDELLPNRKNMEENLSSLVDSETIENNKKSLFKEIYKAYTEVKKELEDDHLPFCQLCLNAQLTTELGHDIIEIFKNQEVLEFQEKKYVSSSMNESVSHILKSVDE